MTAFVSCKHSKIMRGMFSKEVCNIIEQYFYFDDGSGGHNTVEGCMKLCDKLDESMSRGTLTLGKWKFSHKVLREGNKRRMAKSRRYW